ncbi:YdcF family protein [Aceticella autotrophica]|uniref:YdcF family protein n=1 Tax=Aceticella autotrophica TaxID=2755338 RepID=A0A975AWV0_9THEO|nr:YdcF family protein [Aceticella autotrophica]QSZ27950.1 YdcF family protein [Aceticella autotrophica]
MSRFLKLVVVLIFALVSIIAILTYQIISFGSTEKPKKSDAIIVLGCAVYGNTPSPFFKERLEEALKLYKEGYGRYIIISGGKGPGESISEAEAGKRYLLEKNVPSKNILLDNKSFSTYENLLFSKEIMEKNSFKTAIIVSNKSHLKRASIITKRIGIDASFSGVFVKEYVGDEVYGFLREVPALFCTYTKGW